MATKSKLQKAEEKAQALVEAQVQFYLQDLNSKSLKKMLEIEAGFVFDELGKVKLKQAVAEKKVKATAQRYAVEMEIGGGIPELFGEIASVIYNHPESKKTKIGDIVSDEMAEELLDKVFEEGSVLDHSVTNIRNSQAFRDFVSDLVYTVVKGYLLEQNTWMKKGSVSAGTKVLKKWVNNLAPELADNLEDNLRRFTENTVANSLEMFDEVLDSQQYRDTAQNSTLALWDVVKKWPVSRFQDYVTEADLQDFMVLGYEFWHELRPTPFLRSCIDSGVSFFFKKYGNFTLTELLTEIGVTKEMVVSEVLNYGPDLTKQLVKTGIAEAVLRRHLTRFYCSPEALEILQA